MSGFLSFVLFVIVRVTVLFPQGIGANCEADGNRYPNGTVWRADPCTVCTCQCPVSVCESVRCQRKTPCDLSQGQYLELNPSQCCPECRTPSKACHYQGSTLPHNTEWSPGPCETCYCSDGRALCANNTCPQLRCHPGELQQQIPGQCCPLCVPAGRSCSYDGESWPDGSVWHPLPCTKCVCENGHNHCFMAQCPAQHCQQGEELIQTEGACCPQCVGPVCLDRGQQYMSGESWQRDRCSHCLCQNGGMLCTRQTCSQEAPTCGQAEQLVWTDNHCCPTCVPRMGACEHEGQRHYNGAVWRQAQCQYCVCKDGTVQCAEAQCHHVQCAQSEELVHKDGTCCPQCVTYQQCSYAGRQYQHEEMWSPDPCTHCQCIDSDPSCYTQPCERCPLGTVRVAISGACCGQCQPVTCDYQCLSCQPTQPSYCTACRDSNKVLQNGRCWDACSEGYYLDVDNQCKGCSELCLNCTGSSPYHCSSCQPGYLLRDGQCVVDCGPGYLQESDQCVACHGSCWTCSGSRRMQCLSCRVEWQVLKNGRCQDTCGEGYYRLPNNTCTGCDEECQPCLPGSCSACSPGLVLQATMCVPRCDVGYHQMADQSCLECPSRCMQCTEDGQCLQCSSRSFLQADSCVLHCDNSGFHNEKTRTCDAISRSGPVLYDNNTILATTRQMSVVTADMIQAYDDDTQQDELIFRIIQAPTNGKLLKVIGGYDEKLGSHGVFIPQDLREGKIRFHHDPLASLTGHLELYVSGQQLGSPRQIVPILVRSDSRPELVLNQPLFVQQGQKAIIDSQCCLDITDVDSCSAILVKVLQGPQHGRLTLKGQEESANQFTPEDLRSGLLKYSHGNSDESHDHILLQATDGYNILNFVFNIHISPQDSSVPVLIHNKPAYVDPGHMVQITPELLQARHQSRSDKGRLVYTLTPPTNNPKRGELLMVVPLPAGGSTEGWRDLSNGMMGATMFRFLQRDIDEGRIWYKHIGGKNKDDYFIFEVSDGGNPPNLLKEQEFDILVTQPQSDYPVVIDSLNRDLDYFGFPSDVPTIAPGVRLGMTVLENQLVPIQSSALEFSDVDTAASDLRYHITAPLSWEEGSIEHLDRPFQPLDEFTQAEINENKIIYRPPADDVGHEKKTVKFKFTVEDGENELNEQDFAINVIPVNNMPPKLANPKPSVLVTQGGTVPIGSGVITVSDPDTTLDNLVLTLEKNPLVGYFVKRDGKLKVFLRAGDTFTYSEILSNVFYYTHDGSDVLQDTLQLTIEDGVQSIPIKVNVTVVKVDKAAPVLDPMATMTLTLPEGKSRVFNRSHLSFTDGDTTPDDIHITIATETMHGGVYFRDASDPVTVGDSFTMADVDAGLVKYTAEKEVGIKVMSEVIYFNVSDSSHNNLPLQLLAVTITPVNDQPPVVTVGAGVELEEGGQITLTLKDISAMDIDTPLAQLAVFVDSLPSFGILENTRTASPDTPSGTVVTSFTLQDLLDGHIHYRQNNHQDKEPDWDLFLFHVSDGVNDSPTSRFNISILPTNDESPMLITEQIFCQEGRGVLINNASMFVLDFDTPASELQLSVDTLPEHGSLRLKNFPGDMFHLASVLEAGDSFSYQDVLNELFGYVHGGEAEINTDHFTLSVTDGKFSESKVFSVVIGLVNDETPRLQHNTGLRLTPGQTISLRNSDLKATDADSEDSLLSYRLTEAPSSGKLQLKLEGAWQTVTPTGPFKKFQQRDIDEDRVQYVHTVGEPAGVITFKFDVADQHDNILLDQAFVVTVFEDRIPPRVSHNRELKVTEGGTKKITTEYLSATDVGSQAVELMYRVEQGPMLGHLALAHQPDTPITEFAQSDLAADTVTYIHTSDSETYSDNFIFTLTDSTNEITQKFYISILPVDDSLPKLRNTGLRVQEGIRKLITEFELKAVDLDTEDSAIVFEIVKLPEHGQVELKQSPDSTRPTTTFSMADVYENRVTYRHDGSEFPSDSFQFVVSDSTHTEFVVTSDLEEDVTTTQAQTFYIEVTAVDDGTPILTTNLGLQYLEYDAVDGQSIGLVTSSVLTATDTDTSPVNIGFHLTEAPLHGHLEHLEFPGLATQYFTQEDLNNNAIRYVLTGNHSAFHDKFSFDVKDTKPNTASDTFHIQWSVVDFEQQDFNVSEAAEVIKVPLKRYGNLKQYSIVMCETVEGSATSRGISEGSQDFVKHIGQVQFEEWEDTKTCNLIINDDNIYEGSETFYVTITDPVYSLLGMNMMATVHIQDDEDEPVIEFEHSVYAVNESAGFLKATLLRTGDTSSTSSVICYTKSLTAVGSSARGLESGSDYQTRAKNNHNRVVFPPGVTMATCGVRIIDDATYETTEEFQLLLTDPSVYSRLGDLSQAVVIVEGPNDASIVSLSDQVYFTDEGTGQLKIPVVRHGSDLSHTSLVWCATRMTDPPSATPGQDYIPSSRQITFQSGETEQVCLLDLLDDEDDPRLEGNETFVVFLGSAVGSMLTEPQSALVVINDTASDIPLMQFTKEAYIVDEKDKVLQVPVVRSGDLSYQSSIICYTRQRSARVAEDYAERTWTEESRIYFEAGEKVKNCSVILVDDEDHEADEVFLLKLSDAEGSVLTAAGIGDQGTASITLTNAEDIPRIQIEQAAYSVHEPAAADESQSITVRVMRFGDRTLPARVRVSTRDGSAISGVDYNAKSRLLRFKPGDSALVFTVDILYNPDIEWHETFSIALGPHKPSNAIFGNVTSATVTVLDNEVSGSLVLPAPPMVVSLLDYDDAESGSSRNPAPGYPLVCLTPCDPHFPTYEETRPLCEKGQINSTAMLYKWEVAMPLDVDGSRPPFERVRDNTVFTSVNSKVLDSIYFRPKFHIRCMAQPLHKNGNLGVPLRSTIVTIGVHNGLCHTPVTAGHPHGFHAQSFVAALKYIQPTDKDHPNTIQISVRIPHQDGLLPLVSTLPIHNLRYLLSEPVYRQQHLCSNFILPKERRHITRYGFIHSRRKSKQKDWTTKKPYQFDATLRGNRTVTLYKHLNLETCTWHFQGWFHMTELVDLCGGTVISDFEVRDAAQSYLTVQVPLHVSYLYAAAPTGWSSLEHRTEMEFSFFYNTVQWKAGFETAGSLSGRIQLLKVATGPNGNLVMDFKTQAKFRGQYVLDHYTMPDDKSQVTPPEDSPLTLDLSLMWSQQTFDSPSQIWRATSNYNLRDYSGEYTVELMPCTVPATQGYTASKDAPLVCTAHEPQTFVIPIVFQQTSRPVPVTYSLNTDFLLTSNSRQFSGDPTSEVTDLSDSDVDGLFFSPGQTVYGRVMWDPAQDLDSAYSLQIRKVFICTGREGYIPTFDPTGEEYKEGPQFGCMEPTTRLKHRFLILDRGDPDVVDTSFNGVSFGAGFISQNPTYSNLQQITGMDGFTFNVDPLYKGETGHQWFVQVIYIIGPADKVNHRRYQRSPMSQHRLKRAASDWTNSLEQKNGTNMHSLQLDSDALASQRESHGVAATSPASIIAPVVSVIVLLVLLLLLCLLLVLWRRRRLHKSEASSQTAVCMTSQTSCAAASQDLSRQTDVSKTTVRQVPPVHVKPPVRTRRNRWSLRPKSGTEV